MGGWRRGVILQIFSGTWTVPSVRPNDEAPEVLTTPGASFLGSGGRYAGVYTLPVPVMLPVAGQVGTLAT